MATMRHSATIDLENAKTELFRINSLLQDEPLLLIGGLAVQQYDDARTSRDIDLVASGDTVKRLVGKLYPTLDWQRDNTGTDIHPNYKIWHKVKPITIYFGPKVTERGEYDRVSWDTLWKDTKPFRYQGTDTLEKIRVPLPAPLAYSKLISFIKRFDTDRVKAGADIKDFVNLSNHPEFSLSFLFDAIRFNAATDYVRDEIAKISTRFEGLDEIMSGSCMSYFADMWPAGEAAGNSYNVSVPIQDVHTRQYTLYFAAPHRNTARNSSVAELIRKAGMVVKLPYEEVHKVYGSGTPADRYTVRSICVNAILASDGVLVDADHYGLDTAWEVGYADGLGKYVLGLNEALPLMSEPRMINRRSYSDNFMHGWSKQVVFQKIDDIGLRYQEKSIYICGSFHNEKLDEVRQGLAGKAKRVIFPMDYIPQDSMPRDYPLQTKANAINQIDACDVLLVVLPRYGMDSSWQIGYATAKNKEIVGLLMKDDNNRGDYKSLWDHWMHGWREKDIVTGTPKVCAMLKGFVEAGII